jgi:hypothetical protein
MPAHSHGNGVADDNHSGIMWRGTSPTSGVGTGLDNAGSGPIEGRTETVGGGQAHGHSIGADGAHTHDISISGAGDHQHGISAFSVIQPSLALHYICKI